MHTILTSTGRLHHLDGEFVHTLANVPSVQEIAHALAQINRFTGHCSRPYSVAEHSLLVLDIGRATYDLKDEPLIELTLLMHDAHEIITGDVASPIKRVLGQAWEAFECQQQAALLDGYGLLGTFREHYEKVKHADLIALATELRDLMPWTKSGSAPWDVLDKRGEEVKAWSERLLTVKQRGCLPWGHWRMSFELQAGELLQRAAVVATAEQNP